MSPDATEQDGYLSVGDGAEIEIKEKASRFIGQVFVVGGEDDVRARIEVLRRRYHDARHHCSAWRLGPPESPRERGDDDGEPNGTAGPPMLELLRRDDLLDVLVVVTRYFGGTKLGTGGLVRAYSAATRAALEAAPRRTVWLDAGLRVQASYADVGSVEAVLSRLEDAVRRVERVFEAQACFNIQVRRSRAADLALALREATAGRAQIEQD